jgi:hypothetical protein
VGWEVDDVVFSLNNWDGEWIHDPHTGINATLEYAKVHYNLGYTEKLLTQEDLFDTSFYDEVVIETVQQKTQYPTPNFLMLAMDVTKKWFKRTD